MAALAHRTYAEASAVSLAGDLSRYGSGAHWRGVYYRGDKIGFTVSQTTAAEDGFQLQEDGRLEMSLLGAARSVVIRTSARVDRSFALRTFDFSLDPGTGPVSVAGAVHGTRLALTIKTPGSSRSETRELSEPPMLALNLSRRLVDAGLEPGRRHRFSVFDPATLTNAPVVVSVGERELVSDDPGAPFSLRARVPAFRVQMELAGLRTTSWVTDTGEVIREESPMGLVAVRQSARDAMRKVASVSAGRHLLDDAAVVPQGRHRIVEPRDVRRLRMSIEGADLPTADVQGAGQRVTGNLIELVDPRTLEATAIDRAVSQFLAPEPLLESADPAILEEAELAVARITGDRARAERLVRHVHALIEKKPTIGLPSAREVLRTRVGDCNEHTALYVAMARAIGLPARIAVGLTNMRGAFYYHAWPEVYVTAGGRGLWLPVDPTLNQFPADATHLRLARGGLDKQAAILPLIGRIKLTIQELELAPGATPVLIGRPPENMAPLSIPLPSRHPGDCWYDRLFRR